MKKSLYTLLFVLVAVSCNDNYRYTVSGTIAGANEGDKIVLFFSPNGFDKDIIGTTTIADGKFFFDGEIDEPAICYIGYECGDTSLYAMFFLEAGDIRAEITEARICFAGTPNNDKNRECEDTLACYLAILDSIETQFYTNSLTVDDIARLSIKGYETQRRLVAYLRKSTIENIDNLFGLFMLVVYNDFFESEEFSRLIKEIPYEFADNNNGFLYNTALGIASKKRDANSHKKRICPCFLDKSRNLP